MAIRRQWVQLIETAWRERPIVWLSGVRCVGKTCLDHSLPAVTYFDCESPRVRQTMTDPQGRTSSSRRMPTNRRSGRSGASG
jgi:uncharacterized protein